MKDERIRKNGITWRILGRTEKRILAFNLSRPSMPVWLAKEELDDGERITTKPSQKELTEAERAKAFQRYSLIAPVLPVLGNQDERNARIKETAITEGISPKTVQRYLYAYLASLDVYALAPRQRKVRELSADETNIRWALNKYFYTKAQHTLTYCYRQMLLERYTKKDGSLKGHPSYKQFYYFYRTHKRDDTYYISRYGLSEWQRNHRPLIGGSVQEYVKICGKAAVDSTKANIYLLDEKTKSRVVGRPTLALCVDLYSTRILGFYAGWDEGIFGVAQLMQSVWADQGKLAGSGEEPHTIPSFLLTDNGAEYVSDAFRQLEELGCQVQSLDPFRPDLKGTVEAAIGLVQDTVNEMLKEDGVITPYLERQKYKQMAKLTLTEYRDIVTKCIQYLNTKRAMQYFPFTRAMLKERVKPYPKSVWDFCERRDACSVIPVSERSLCLTLLPRTKGKLTRRGLIVNGLRYASKDKRFALQYGKCEENQVIAYAADNTDTVYLITENGEYCPFELVSYEYSGMTFEEVAQMRKRKKEIFKSVQQESLEAAIALQGVVHDRIPEREMTVDISEMDIQKEAEKREEKEYAGIHRRSLSDD